MSPKMRTIQGITVLKLWQPVTLQPLEAHGQVVIFEKPPISHCLEPGGHGGGRTFRAKRPRVRNTRFIR